MSDEPSNFDSLIQQIRDESQGKGPKDSKGSARAKYNRRKIVLARALEGMAITIDHLRAQSGKLYKAKEVDTLQSAIETFRNTTGLKEAWEPLTQDQMDHITEALANGKPWTPPSEEVMEELRAVLEWAKVEGLRTEDLDD